MMTSFAGHLTVDTALVPGAVAAQCAELEHDKISLQCGHIPCHKMIDECVCDTCTGLGVRGAMQGAPSWKQPQLRARCCLAP